ncbi:MAG: DNA mismatch repair endonuclease MutL [Endomicrobium sp.]|jgi:DNA mismatch repair protein MutL|nr:DNA mismatch repair endonuclease MutL [Endomicrobium sp.]
MPINILSQETINRIAAGEVVERPLNVVKELVENSLDANASSITVEIEKSGKKLIRVSDNGFGMDKKDLELSILRHSTSKIKNFDDLSHVSSLGFRGEALASIANVSNFKMKTKTRIEDFGWKLSIYGNKDIEIVPWSGAEGTIIEVKNLFFNTPARQKFLKSNYIERSKIISSIEEISLANQETTFKIFSENKSIFSTLKTDKKKERISDVLGENFARNLRNIKVEHSRISLDIYFTGRNDSLSSRKYQYLFVNSRSVNYPKCLTHCIYKAYKSSTLFDRHPGILIYIIIAPSEIDVNIHPTKREIKFADENGVYNLLFRALKNDLILHIPSQIPINLLHNNMSNYNFKNVVENYDEILPYPTTFIKEKAKSNCDYEYNFPKQYINNSTSDFAKQKEFDHEGFCSNIRILGQVFWTYIIVENYNYLYIFDQHAAAERVKYELYLLELNNQIIKVQDLLIPEIFSLPKSTFELLKANINIFNEIGINIEEFGGNSFRISAYPALLGCVSIKEIVKTIISDIEEDKNIEIYQRKDKIIRSACHASIKAGDKILSIEAKKLLNDLFKCEYPFTCPHGRPTVYRISLKELEKFFKRK